MSSLEEQTVISVTAPWIDGTVSLTPLIEVDGKKYFRLAKCCNKTIRLLTGRSIGKTRALSQTSILEMLQQLRKEKHAELCAISDRMQSSSGDDDLGLDAPDPKRLKQFDKVLPTTVVIRAPAVGDVEGVDISILTARDANAVTVEVCSTNLDYLHAVVNHQLQQQSSASEEPIATEKPRGATWIENRLSYRLRYKIGDKLTCKFFKAESNSDADKDVALQSAREFLAGVPTDGS